MYRAVAEAMRKHATLWLCHVGRGELEPEVRALAAGLGISDRCVSIPYLDCPSEIYRAFDAFALTSRYEGCPLVLGEALASSLPLVVTRAPGTSLFLDGGLTHCWTAKVGDVNGVACAIESWVLDIQNQRLINHRQIAEERFSPGVLFGTVHRLYSDAIGEHPSGERTTGT